MPTIGFNPRTPCGVRRLAGSCWFGMTPFQSTHSLRSATAKSSPRSPSGCVSIHALLAECDIPRRWREALPRRFNPRTPCGVRLTWTMTTSKTLWFQSTHSLRSATIPARPGAVERSVSIHALLAECDFTNGWLLYTSNVSIHALLAECDTNSDSFTLYTDSFNPRTPCGVRLRLTIYIVIQQRKRYFAPTSRRRPSSPSLLF